MPSPTIIMIFLGALSTTLIAVFAGLIGVWQAETKTNDDTASAILVINLFILVIFYRVEKINREHCLIIMLTQRSSYDVD